MRPRGFWGYFFGALIGGLLVLCVASVVGLSSHGQWAALLLGLFVLGLLAMLVYMFGATLWADRERVGTDQLFNRASCPRNELESIQLLAVGRALVCNFVRQDGTVVFTTPWLLWSNGQLQAMADFLGVPLEKGARNVKRGYVCPVCGFRGLEEPASLDGRGSGELCPSCGFEHRGAVDQERYRQWREQWTGSGMSWWAAQAGVPAPKGWDPAGQLKAIEH